MGHFGAIVVRIAVKTVNASVTVRNVLTAGVKTAMKIMTVAIWANPKCKVGYGAIKC